MALIFPTEGNTPPRPGAGRPAAYPGRVDPAVNKAATGAFIGAADGNNNPGAHDAERQDTFGTEHADYFEPITAAVEQGRQEQVAERADVTGNANKTGAKPT